MSNQYETLKQEHKNLEDLQKEFTTELETGNLPRTRELKLEMEQKRDALAEKLWPFKELPQKEFKEQYERVIKGYQELNLLETLTSGKEGIKDEKGKEYPVLSLQEIEAKLMENEAFFMEKIATLENPRIHLTPFALSPEILKDKYSQLIEEHFVEERVEGDKRIPDKNKTKLLGVDKEPLSLEARADKQNVYHGNFLKGLTYFPDWEEGTPGITKEQAIAQVGGWGVSIVEDIPLAPEKDQGKTIEKEIKIKGKLKKVSRKQVEGGMTTAEQYTLLKKQNEEGFTLEDWLSYAMLYLKENNVVLDDGRRTNYYCRLLGSGTADLGAGASDGRVPGVYWDRVRLQAHLGRDNPKNSNFRDCARGLVRLH